MDDGRIVVTYVFYSTDTKRRIQLRPPGDLFISLPMNNLGPSGRSSKVAPLPHHRRPILY